MAKITVVGKAVVVSSTLKTEDIKLIGKYRPDSLTLFEGEGKDKQPVFRVDVGEGRGSIGAYGIEFNGTNAEGFATVTRLLPDGLKAENVKDWVSDEIGVPTLKLGKLEAALPAVAAEIATEKATIDSMLTIQ